MKPHIVLVFLAVFMLTGCNQQVILLSGESESWEGEYTANVDGSTESGKFVFGYKKGKRTRSSNH